MQALCSLWLSHRRFSTFVLFTTYPNTVHFCVRGLHNSLFLHSSKLRVTLAQSRAFKLGTTQLRLQTFPAIALWNVQTQHTLYYLCSIHLALRWQSYILLWEKKNVFQDLNTVVETVEWNNDGVSVITNNRSGSGLPTGFKRQFEQKWILVDFVLNG